MRKKKMRDWKMWQQNVGVEYTGLENERKEKKHGTPQVS